jgi:RimJ/RimL family protein N-acetyltransferase
MGKISRKEYIISEKTLTIRNSEVEDAEELIGLIKKFDNETIFLSREPDEFTITLEQEKEYIKVQQDSKINLFIVAEIDGRIIGTCGLNGSTRKRLRHTADLGISIDKEHWGMGIGRKMMEASIQWAKEHGIARIALEVDTQNIRAINLYLKMGFEIEGKLINNIILADGSLRSSYVMALLN